MQNRQHATGSNQHDTKPTDNTTVKTYNNEKLLKAKTLDGSSICEHGEFACHCEDCFPAPWQLVERHMMEKGYTRVGPSAEWNCDAWAVGEDLILFDDERDDLYSLYRDNGEDADGNADLYWLDVFHADDVQREF